MRRLCFPNGIGERKKCIKRCGLSLERDSLILSSDTIIVCNNEILEKPVTKQRQLEMFKKYQVSPELKAITAVHIQKYHKNTNHVELYSRLDTTLLKFDNLLPDCVLRQYVDCEEGLQVAGGFKYQEKGSILFQGITGDYFNVVGLPVKTTFLLLQDALQ